MKRFSRVTEPVGACRASGWTQGLSAQPTLSLGVHLRISPHHLPPSPMSGVQVNLDFSFHIQPSRSGTRNKRGGMFRATLFHHVKFAAASHRQLSAPVLLPHQSPAAISLGEDPSLSPVLHHCSLGVQPPGPHPLLSCRVSLSVLKLISLKSPGSSPCREPLGKPELLSVAHKALLTLDPVLHKPSFIAPAVVL